MLELPFPSYLAITTSYCVPSSDEESCVWSTKSTAFQDNDLFLQITTSFINFEIMKFTTSNTCSFKIPSVAFENSVEEPQTKQRK